MQTFKNSPNLEGTDYFFSKKKLDLFELSPITNWFNKEA